MVEAGGGRFGLLRRRNGGSRRSAAYESALRQARQPSEESSGVRSRGSGACCVAPHVAMVFDPYGRVQACCANALYPLGDVRNESLHDIWTGARANALRAALERGDLSYGCGICRYRLEAGSGAPRDLYDLYPLQRITPVPDWPSLLSFSLHNTCNLECIMCGGDSSSRIRRNRDGLPGIPYAYGDEFFEQIVPFLENATNVDFIGGEPFLVPGHGRIWEMLVEIGRPVAVSVTTNGTIWNEKVERWLEHLDTSVFLSIDGVTRSTFEGVRVGASFDSVMENLERFRSYCSLRGTDLILSWSLVRQNWFEFGDFMLFAEERDLQVQVQTVLEPDFGVQRLPTAELETVVSRLEAEGRHLVPRLTRNRAVWEQEVGRLKEELDRRRRGLPRTFVMEPPDDDNFAHADHVVHQWRQMVEHQPKRRWPLAGRTTGPEVRARSELQSWGATGMVGEVHLDRHLRLVASDLDAVIAGQIGEVDTTWGGLLRQLASRLGSMWIAEEFMEQERLLQTFFFGPAVRDKRGVVVRCIAVPKKRGVVIVVASDETLLGRQLDTAGREHHTAVELPRAIRSNSSHHPPGIDAQ